MFKSCDDTTFTSYGIKDGLADNYIRALAEGLPEDIWISTNSGISCLSTNTKKIRNFNQFDGVPLGNFMSGAVAKANDGTIYFGSQNGICYFNSKLEQSAYKLPPVVITGFSIINKEKVHTGDFTDIPVSQKINLSYNQNTFNVSFNVLDHSLNDMVEFSYIMKGLENTWYNVLEEKQLTFRNLRPGKYTFTVKTRLRNREWTEKRTSIEIIIHPPFWFSWWAYAVYVIIVLIAAFRIMRFYKRKLELENSLIFEKKTHQKDRELNDERLSFYTNIAHELRTPLTLIIGPLEDLTTDKSIPSVYAKKISLIHRSAIRLLNLINQILEFRKSETHKRNLCVSKVDISTLIHEIGLKYEELNQNKNVQFKISIESTDPMLFFDPDVITIIMDNLISNALKYTEKGEIELALRNVRVEDTDYTEIEVRDTGYGIPAEALPEIFDRYFQAKGEHQVSGSGIGLSLVKNLAELHEGIISVESKVDEGSSFKLKLITNNTYPNVLHAEIKVVNTEIKEIEAETKRSILIVEDNAEIREYIAGSFSDTYEIMLAENGKIGAELAFNRIPSIIVSDIMMPVMNGIDFCKIIKEDIRTSHIPVILLTAKDSLQDKTEGYSIGADSYITKPFSASLLHSRINNLLESRRKMAELFSTSIVQKQSQYKESLSTIDTGFFQKLDAYILENIASDQINIVFIADRLNMSYSTLYRKIKALTNISPNEYIRKIKMKHAEKLLLTGKYTISEIAFQVGINSQTYFRQCFKDEFAANPTEYIKQFRE